MKVQIYHFNQKVVKGKLIHDLVPTHLGYVEVEKFDTVDDAEHIYDLCNWNSWAEEKPKNLYANISACTHGLCIDNPITQEKWLTLSQGWLVGTSTEISDYVFNHRYEPFWGKE